MKESEAAALWQGFVHGEGTGWQGQVDLALGFSLVWSGPGIRTFTATGDRPVQEHEPTLFEIWVCADGYWCDHTKNVCPGDARPAPTRSCSTRCSTSTGARSTICRPGASLAELDLLIRDGLAEAGYPGQPSHPICARRRRPGARAALRAPVRRGHDRGRNGARDRAGRYWDGGGGLRIEDNFLITADGPEKLSSYPDEFLDDVLDRPAQRSGTASTRRSGSTTRPFATASKPSASCFRAPRTSSSWHAGSMRWGSSGSKQASHASRRPIGVPSS